MSDVDPELLETFLEAIENSLRKEGFESAADWLSQQDIEDFLSSN
jgi:hypothetical protein